VRDFYVSSVASYFYIDITILRSLNFRHILAVDKNSIVSNHDVTIATINTKAAT
jgi:hypothetical protein